MYHIIVPIDALYSDNEEDANEPLYAIHHDALSDALRVGDNFVVNAKLENDEGAEFYILK